MSLELILHGRPISSVFELLGTKENDITYSVGWALGKSPHLLKTLLNQVFPNKENLIVDSIQLQKHGRDRGFTDIELRGRDLHVIVEAKRGWCIPATEQWERYHDRLHKSDCKYKALVAMSECSPEYAKIHLKDLNGTRVTHIGWREIQQMAGQRSGTQAEKRLLEELKAYLERIVKIQNQESNMVFLVTLSDEKPKWSPFTWKEIVCKCGRYFHPVGNGWPKHPPNYIGYHYDGHLQTIHHIES